MAQFEQRLRSDDRILTTPQEVWAVLIDPVMLATLTPLVDRITVDGDRWRWRLTRVSGLGMTAAPEFTTVMRLDDGQRIEFRPAPERDERATATGHLTVQADGTHTRVAIDIIASVDLPLPAAMRRPVRRMLYQTMKAGGTRFARNLLAHLGDPPHRGLDVTAAG